MNDQKKGRRCETHGLAAGPEGRGEPHREIVALAGLLSAIASTEERRAEAMGCGWTGISASAAGSTSPPAAGRCCCASLQKAISGTHGDDAAAESDGGDSGHGGHLATSHISSQVATLGTH